MSNFTIEVQDGIAVVWLDQQGEPINKISVDLMAEFKAMMDEVEGNGEVKGAVLISKKKDFIAGADIEMFSKIPPEQFLAQTMEGHGMMKRLQNSKKPFVAAIHGACMGAGTEIALACAGRVVADSSKSMIALPEVRLGLLPGLGGTQRLPRLIGIQKALDMMLTGKNIYARQAKKFGLVDSVAPQESLLLAAKRLVLDILTKKFQRKKPLPFMEKVLESTSFTRNIVFKKAKEMVLRQTKGNYPAPINIIKAVQYGFGKSLDKGLENEAKLFVELIQSPESKQLINVFFGMTALKKNPMKDLAKETNILGLLGAGFMGIGIAEVSMTKGMDVILKDISADTLAEAKADLWKGLSKKIKYKTMTKVDAEAVINRVTGQLDYHNFEHVDMVIEAVFEDMGLKQRILAETEAVIREDCVFATNTSALPVTEIAKHAKHPERIIGMHYFSPVPKMPLLEIVVTEDTADWVVASALEVGVRQGKTCIVVKDKPGFYTTRILGPYMNEALMLLKEGGDIQQIDGAMKKWGFPVGPITLMDEVGIDVGAHVQEGDLRKMFDARMKEMGISEEDIAKQTTPVMKKLADAGYKGRKNNKGFFLYDEKGKKKRGVVNEEIYSFFGGSKRKKISAELIQERMALVMVNEAVRCLEEEVLRNPMEGDIGAIFGLGFRPFSGGPFRYIDSRGAKDIVEAMLKLKSEYGIRFTPSEMLVRYAEEGKLFHS